MSPLPEAIGLSETPFPACRHFVEGRMPPNRRSLRTLSSILQSRIAGRRVCRVPLGCPDYLP